jgi:anti-sigma regulatory factor (Ser/Thr protein kinase)
MTRSSGRGHLLSFTFRDLTCLSVVRRWLRSNLPPEGDLANDAELVCCELVTNAFEHGGGTGACGGTVSGKTVWATL